MSKKYTIRLNKRTDLDLLSLHDMGYPIPKMIRIALDGYIDGTPVYFYIDESVRFDKNDKQSIRCTVSLDGDQIGVVKEIKHYKINDFLKLILRNSLVMQNLSAYFGNNDKKLQQINEKYREAIDTKIVLLDNVILGSEIKKGNTGTKKQLQLNKNEVKSTKTKIKISHSDEPDGKKRDVLATNEMDTFVPKEKKTDARTVSPISLSPTDTFSARDEESRQNALLDMFDNL